MNEANKLKLKIIYAFFMGVLITVAVVVAIKAFNVWDAGKRGLSKEDMESARRLREADGMDSAGSRSRAPYVMYRPEPNYKGEIVINSLGFHSPEIAKVKAADEYRIAMLGGSVVFTNGPRRLQSNSNTPTSTTEYLDHSIIAMLAKALKERLPGLANKKVTFINAGIASGVSGQELAQLQHYIIPLNIDLLIVYDGFNDFYMPFNYEKRPGYPYDYIVEEYRYLKGREGIGGKDALQNSDKMYHELGIQIPGTEEAKKETLEKYFFNIAEMVKVSEGFGIRTGVFLQPYSERNTNPLLSTANHHPIKLYNAAQKAFSLLGRNNNSRTVFQDMTYMNDRLDGLFVDVGHTWWNPSHQMIADEMFKHLDAAGVFENLKGSTAKLSSGELSARTVEPTYYDRIQEVLATAEMGLEGDFTEKELAKFKSIGNPGVGDLALKAFNEYYGGELPPGLKKSLSDEANNGKRLLDEEKDKLGIKRVDAETDTLKFKNVDLSADLCIGGLALSGGDHKDGYLAAMAFDKNEATIWGSAQVGEKVAGAAYIGYDFGAYKKYAVRRVVLKQGGRIEKIRVQSKTEASGQWADVAATVKYQKNARDIIELVNAPAARYWRLLAASNAGDAPAAWTVYEIQMMALK